MDFADENFFEESERPEVALITNHGYASPNIEIGGAPDTGGQVLYVNVLALKLEELGYKVTIYSRGGFPEHSGSGLRTGVCSMSKFTRYEYLLGGGSEFLPKEEISSALKQESYHLYNIVQKKAKARGCKGWQVFEFVDSHYWDAGIIGVNLVEFWQNDLVYDLIEKYFGGQLTDDEKFFLYENRHWKNISKSPVFQVIKVLFKQLKGVSVQEKAKKVIEKWEAIFGENLQIDCKTIEQIFENLPATEDDSYRELEFISFFAKKIYKNCEKFRSELESGFAKTNKHIWTPHSLGEIKSYNLRKDSLEDRIALRLCERNSHEKNICVNTSFFASTSTEITDCLFSYYNVKEDNIFYFHPQVDGNIFRVYSQKELAPAYEYLADKTNVAVKKLQKSKIFFETSRMDRTKRKDLIIAAYEKIFRDYEDTFLFIGGGPKNKIYEALQKQLSTNQELQKRVFLLDYIPEKFIGHLFYIADIYVSASEMEGFGMSVAQATAGKSQIISSDLIPFAKNFVADWVEIFPHGNADKLADLMRKCLDKPNTKNLKKLNEMSKKLVWLQATQRFLNFLNRKGLNVKNGVEN